ncbi:MAG TPA: hypothetical protein VGE29_07540 [Prosthecobacter sp.]
MNTMLELSMDAHYDVIASCLIVTIVLMAKTWIHFRDRAVKITK